MQRYPFHPFELISTDPVDKHPFKVAFKPVNHDTDIHTLIHSLKNYLPYEGLHCRIVEGVFVIGVEEKDFNTSLLGTSDDVFEIYRFEGDTRMDVVHFTLENKFLRASK